jgi:hypothetical protein
MKPKSPSILILALSMTIANCSHLEERYDSNLTGNQVGQQERAASLLYRNLQNTLLNPFQNFQNVIALSELTTDELIAPARGPDWDDNGVWRELHQHRWTPDHTIISDCFNSLGGVIFAATDLLNAKPTIEQERAARFYRAFAMFWMLDLYNQVPYRDPGELTLVPARVRTGVDALNFIVSELEGILNLLPEATVTEPSKNAARVLLMKCFLNKAVYVDRLIPAFAEADMNKVISLADGIINSNEYTLSVNYFDNFAPNNSTLGTENIFTQENIGGVYAGEYLWVYQGIPLHYNSTPDGSNGWATLSHFYDKFEPADLRRGQAYATPGGPPNPGSRINLGFLAGQQYNLFTDAPLIDGTARELPLIFTREVKLIETGENLQVTGIRPQKYAVDLNNFYTPDNDWVYFRLADVLLMKAEAIFRGGAPTSAGAYGSSPLQLVNSIRTHPSRGATALTAIDNGLLLDERGREFWLECWRRQDLIRFGKFLEPFQEKEFDSDPRYLIFPIPNQQLSVNKNLTKNPGY